MNKPADLSFRTAAIVGITLLALAFGGSTELWAQAVILLGAAILILFFPPHRALPALPSLVFLLFLGLAFSAFLPADLGIIPEWRRHLTIDLQAPLGDLRTPQPWITFQSCGLLFFGLVWIYYLFALEWKPGEKSEVLSLLVTGVVLLATVSNVAYLTGYRIPGWNQEQNRGWFPNRNQTSDVLALTGIVNYVIAFKRLQNKQWSGLGWLVGLAMICVALVISFSRAGILMFFAGIVLWHLASIGRRRQAKSLAMGLSALLLLLSLFLLFGGTTLERFLNVPQSDLPPTEDYRILIQEDALKVSLNSPFLGVGLGNFEPVFTSMRQASADQFRTLHPESDWLWMAVEMGWLAPLLVVIGLKWWVNQCLPFASRSGESLRRAAMVAAILFVVHGFVDVSGHRLGSIMVGMFMAGVALSPHRPEPVKSRWIALLFRGLAVILALIGTWWLASFCADMGPPTTATLARLQTRIDLAASEGRLASVSEAANAGLDIAPLNWSYYFRRASAEAFRTGATDQAANDFQIARFLQPNWIDLCVNEGQVWFAAGESARCIDAWNEALRRSGPKGPTVYATLLGLSQNNPEVHQGLGETAATNIDYLITFLNYATPEEEKLELNNLLYRDPDLHSLTSEEQKKLFSAWYAHGDQDDLADHLLRQTDWQLTGWNFLALHFANQKDFEMATLTALKYLPPPVIQKISTEQSLTDLKALFDSHSDDVVDGVLMSQKQIEDNRIDDALATLSALEQRKDCPRYIFYLKAQLYVKKQEWEQAWDTLLEFGGI